MLYYECMPKPSDIEKYTLQHAEHLIARLKSWGELDAFITHHHPGFDPDQALDFESAKQFIAAYKTAYAKDDFIKAKAYFKTHPGAYYAGKRERLKFSYVKIGETILQRDDKIGEGAFGSVKYGQAEDTSTPRLVIKRQKISADDLASTRQEAEANVDLQIATGPLVTREWHDKKTRGIDFKAYQPMRYMGQSLTEVIGKASFAEKEDLAIDLLLKVDMLHSGKAAISRSMYAHADIKPANITVDEKGEVHLIDLGLATKDPFIYPLSHICYKGTPAYQPRDISASKGPIVPTPSAFFDDKIAALRTIYHPHSLNYPGIFSRDEVRALPQPLQTLLDTRTIGDVIVDQDRSIRLIAASLIFYKKNKQITEKDIDELKRNSAEQDRLISEHRTETFKKWISDPSFPQQKLSKLQNSDPDLMHAVYQTTPHLLSDIDSGTFFKLIIDKKIPLPEGYINQHEVNNLATKLNDYATWLDKRSKRFFQRSMTKDFYQKAYACIDEFQKRLNEAKDDAQKLKVFRDLENYLTENIAIRSTELDNWRTSLSQTLSGVIHAKKDESPTSPQKLQETLREQLINLRKSEAPEPPSEERSYEKR